MQMVQSALLWFAILSAGTMAGVYFAFSVFIMQALGALERPGGMLAMRSINRVILRSAFIPLFLASSAVCAVLAVWGAVAWQAPGGWQMGCGGALYVAGMFGVTMLGNVPLNNMLERTDPLGPEAEQAWRRYLLRWTAWNHLRTLSCLAATALLVAALLASARA